MYETTLKTPPRFQFEPSSGTLECSQVYNCGPTGATQQADFYLERRHDIEETRIRATVPRCRPTTAREQANMLAIRGVPCEVVVIESLAELDALLGEWPWRRPIGIGVLMSRMPAKVRGHSFTGWHRITILARSRRKVKVNGVYRFRWGYTYTDPNFGPHRPDPKEGKRWIRRGGLRHAFIDNQPAIAIVPLYAKKVKR